MLFLNQPSAGQAAMPHSLLFIFAQMTANP